MSEQVGFRRGAVRPVQCIHDGWELIKDEYWLFLGLALAAILIGGFVPLGILMGAMMCGLYRCFFARMRGEPVSFDTLWFGFDYFVPGLIVTFAMIAVMLIVFVPFELVLLVALLVILGGGQSEPSGGELAVFFGIYGVSYIVLLGVSLAIHVFTLFIYPLLVDRKLRPFDAIATGVKASWANLGGVIGLLLLCWAISLLGLCACIVGSFLLFPVYFAAMAVAYRQVFPDLQTPEAVGEVESELTP